MSLLDNLPHKASITTRTVTTGDMGGERETFPTTAYKDEPCWVQSATAAEIEEWEKRGHAISHKVYFNRDLAMTHDNRIELTAPTRLAGLRLEFRGVMDASAGLGVLYRCVAENKLGRGARGE